ncbi:uncharacterized protein BKCO1_8000227 [Diplodia corticola]|uniref:Uncharacterized protein n=1 Tax=Diplodia corticola TaxID=236234 RepID=A0A1J9SBX5_9PEZI|nr:uncharacterized protein BKCO1_8000227 [Diplodia corticola]OJD37085.1 hypothetical protein BKCO1_8000227 [Diplodia corticola]
MPKPLTITPAPFRPSKLSIPPSPFSPRLPLTPPASTPKEGSLVPNRNKRELSSPSTPPPSPPLKWIWQCHVCHRAYLLGMTRRCLDDGHYFCSGVTTVKTWRASANPRKGRRTKKHRACASEFDYGGWKAFGEWRRNEEAIRRASFADTVDFSTSTGGFLSPRPSAQSKVARNCWNTCDFPSECRWGSQHGVQAACAASPILPSPPDEDTGPQSSEVSASTPDAIKLDTALATNDTPPTTFDGILNHSQEGELSPLSPKELRGRFWDGILDSARQRRLSKSGKAHSPLTLNPVTEKDEPVSPSDLDREQLASPEPAAFDQSTRSKGLFEMSDRWTLSESGQERGHVQIPEPALVVSHGFDFGFEMADNGMDAGIEAGRSDAKSRKKSKKGKRKLTKRT